MSWNSVTGITSLTQDTELHNSKISTILIKNFLGEPQSYLFVEIIFASFKTYSQNYPGVEMVS